VHGAKSWGMGMRRSSSVIGHKGEVSEVNEIKSWYFSHTELYELNSSQTRLTTKDYT
jgi:hypothetical protein